MERLIGTVRRECLNHLIVINERALYRTLTSFGSYYHHWRAQLSLGKDSPQRRRRQAADEGIIIKIWEFGGLHHHYECRAA